MTHRNTYQPAIQKRSPAPECAPPVSGEHWLRYFLLSFCILLCIGFWTVAAAISQMQDERSVIAPCKAVCIHHNKIIFCKPSLSHFAPPASLNLTNARWFWTPAEETESHDKSSVPVRSYLVYGYFPSGITSPGKLSPADKQNPQQLYLQNKSLLC